MIAQRIAAAPIQKVFRRVSFRFHEIHSDLGFTSARFLAFCGCSPCCRLYVCPWQLGPDRVRVTPSYHNDVSPPLRKMAATDNPARHQEREAAENPKIPNSHVDSPDPVVDRGPILRVFAPSVPEPILTFDGIAFPGVGCNCAPPDTNGAVGLTQYVQMVNEGYQVFRQGHR